MAFSDTLKAKAGPLPVWAWGLIVGVIVVAGMYWYSSRGAIAGASSASADDTGLAYPELSGDSSLSAGSSGGGGSSLAGDTTSSVPAFSSNLAWETYVVAALIREGNNPLTVQVALEKYLHGATLGAAEQVIVNQAIARFGLPPNLTDMTPDLETAVPVTTPTATATPGSKLLSTVDLGTQQVGTQATGYSTTTVGQATYSTPAGTATVNTMGGAVVGGYNPTALPAINAAAKANAQNNVTSFLAAHPVASQSEADKKYLAKLYAQVASFG